jgi:hypothetical protein
LAAYQKAGMELPLESANDVNLKNFYEKVKMSGKPIRREIQSIYRMKVGNREVFWYHQRLSSFDALNNDLEVFFPSIGKYDLPTFDYVNDAATGARFAQSIKSHETKYELEWKKDFTPELEQDVIDKVDLIVIAQGRHYGGYSWDEFKNRTFEELVQIGKYGTINPSPKIIETEDQRLREAKRTRQ